MALTSLSTNHQLQSGLHGGSDAKNRVQGAFQSPNQLGSWCALVIPIAAGLMFMSSRKLARALGAVSLLALLAALTFSLSRSAWIGTGAALILMLLTMREARRLLAIIFVPLALIGYVIFSAGAAPPEVKVVGERVQAIGTRSPYDQRSQIYHEALREIREDPVTGVGPGGFVVASRRAGTETSTVAADHAHNLLLNYGAESGLPAVALLLAFVFSLALAAYRGSPGRGADRPTPPWADHQHRRRALCDLDPGILRLHARQSRDPYHRLDADRRLARCRARAGLANFERARRRHDGELTDA